jgi:hypothetical protein
VDFQNLLLSIVIIGIGLFYFNKILKKHKRIDTESIAIVKDVIELGHSGFKKIYAIKYEIQSSEPFDLYESPCSKRLRLGKERIIFFESKKGSDKKAPVVNYYFKTIKQFDKRFIGPVSIISFGIVLLISVIILAIN